MKLGGSVRSRRTLAGVSAVLLAATLGATACSSSDDDSTSTAAGSTSALPENAATGAPVKIGFISTEGGGVVSIPEWREGAEAAVEYVNKNGGGFAGGHSIDLVVCKQAEEPTSATNCANQMVEQKVAAVLTAGTSQGTAIVPIVGGAGIPYITLNGVSQLDVTSPDSFALSSGISGSLVATATAAKAEGMKSMTIFASDGGGTAGIIEMLGKPIFDGFDIDLKVVAIALGVPDPTPLVASGLASNPDGISIISDAALCTSVLKAIQTSAPDAKKVLNTVCLDKSVLDVVGVEAVEGNQGITGIDVFSDRPDSVLYRSVLGQYAPDLSLTGPGAQGYQVLMATVNANANVTGDVDAATIKQAMQATDKVEMPAGGGIIFSCNGTAVPMMTSICSTQTLYGLIDDQGVPRDLQVAG
ncbi:ABC transporter substrate-binding protein [Nocardia sp. 348MFTsu5.1]|uniref:ABC transporter substrate-binding protein n=1 Tax=Nocardia sp. 348MFTsu5.1 TaxID=1172185 RepID=UPI00035F12FF|nr:ABC transporter substrate-binding protein [Nocardia sp. 348MFTsu5.1]